MPTTAVLKDLVHAQVCYLLLIDGVEMGLTDNPLLSATDFTGHGHDIRAYLDPRGTQVEEAIDLRSGKLDETSAAFKLVDLDDALAALFAAEDPTEEPLGTSIYPGDDLVARTDVHSKHVGTEFVGSTGGRHRFPCVSSFQVGDMHVGIDQEMPHLRPSPVSDNPIVWRGRKVCLYRCYIDLNGTRRTFGESDRIWWGMMNDQGTVDGREWQISCSGPQSWLQKELGILTQRDSVPALGQTNLSTTAGQDETGMYVSFDRDATVIANKEVYGTRDFVASITGTTPADIIADIAAELATASAVVGADGAFDAADNRYVMIDGSGAVTIHSDEDAAIITFATMRLVLHKKVWTAIGYDTEEQKQLEFTDNRHVRFTDWVFDAPGSGYVKATIEATDPDDPYLGENSGLPKVYVPLYPGGTTSLNPGLTNGVGQIVDLGNGFGDTIVYHRGQLSRPVASDPDDATAAYPIGSGATEQGLWLFYGKRRTGDVEVDEYQVARASWQAGSLNQQGQVIDGEIVVTEWLDPKQFGFDRKKMTAPWVTRANADLDFRIQAVPILGLDYQGGDSLEQAHVVIERLLRSTGTSTGWSSYSLDPAALLDGGDNDSAGNPRRDGEYADLGLAIPGSMVQNILQFGLEGTALPFNLGRVKVAFTPGTTADTLLEGLMRPHGWCWSLRGGAYGIFSPYRTPSPDEVDFVLDGSTKLGSFGDRDNSISQDLRAFAPIDLFKLDFSWAPHLERFRKTYSVDSKDIGRRYRNGGIIETHRAHGMRYLSGWDAKARELGEWWNKRHFFVTNWPYMGRRPARVGEWVRITDERGVDPAGSYGISEMIGLVVGVQTNLRPDDGDPWCRLKILVYANTSDSPRLHAMIGRAFGYDDANPGKLYMRPNWLGYDFVGGWPGDETFFVEPSFVGVEALGGDMEIAILQWDGNAWRPPITGLAVTGTGSDGTGAYVEVDGAITGYLHRMDTIVIAGPRGTLTAPWALAFYGVVCTKAGTFDGGTAGFDWEDV